MSTTTWNGWADIDLEDLFEELDSRPYPPNYEGFRSVADAANEAVRPIIRHLRHEARTHQRNHSTERAHGSPMTNDRSGSPRDARHGGRARATST